MKSFYILLCIVFGLEVGSSIWYLVTFYRTRGQTLEQCINGSAEPSRVAYCKSLDAYKRVPQGAMLASIIVPILIHACQYSPFISIIVPFWLKVSLILDACYIVYQYTKRLEYQKIEKLRASRSFPQTQPIYQAVNPHDESFPLAQPNPQYPYADGANSFGHVHQNLFGGNNASNKV